MKRKFKMFGKLPQQPSKLIQLALADLKKVEKSKKYDVRMNFWHCPTEDYCWVCLAGSVMAKSLKVPSTKIAEPSDFEESNALFALNYLRRGNVSGAFVKLCLPWAAGGLFDRKIIEYSENKAGFHKSMCKLAYDLKKAGY